MIIYTPTPLPDGFIESYIANEPRFNGMTYTVEFDDYPWIDSTGDQYCAAQLLSAIQNVLSTNA